jgi:hypothetical protein
MRNPKTVDLKGLDFPKKLVFARKRDKRDAKDITHCAART